MKLKRLLFLLLFVPAFASSFSLPQVTATTSYAAIVAWSTTAPNQTYQWVTITSDPANATGGCAGDSIYISIPGNTGTTGQPVGGISAFQSFTVYAPEGSPEPTLNSVQVKASGGSGCLVDLMYGTAKQ